MRVRHLYIIGDLYEGNDEAAAICDGLLEKYVPKSGRVSLYGCRPVKCLDQSEGGGNEPFQHEVGAYVVFHAMGPGTDAHPSGFTPDIFVDTIFKRAMGEDLARLGRLVFIACHLAHSKKTLKDNVHGKTIDTIEGYGEGRGFILSVLLKLHALGVHPQLVGWDSYISAAPHLDPGKSLYGNPRGGGGKHNPTHVPGRKIGHGSRFGLIDDRYRGEHKRTFWIQDGKIVVEGAEGWASD